MTTMLYVEDPYWGGDELFEDNEEGLKRAKNFAVRIWDRVKRERIEQHRRLMVERLRAGMPFGQRATVCYVFIDDVEE
jgi:hypothetical protein